VDGLLVTWSAGMFSKGAAGRSRDASGIRRALNASLSCGNGSVCGSIGLPRGANGCTGVDAGEAGGCVFPCGVGSGAGVAGTGIGEAEIANAGFIADSIAGSIACSMTRVPGPDEVLLSPF